MADKFRLALTTAFALVEQFQQALTSPPGSTSSAELSGKDALPLLSASSTALKAQTTKLSLLAITTPFTPSAVASILADLNESVLPSLVTAALLVTPDYHTKAFQTEVRGLTKTTLKEILSLLTEVRIVADKKAESRKGNKKEADLSQSEKDTVTVATGRAWDSCDVLIDISAKGVVGFVVRRVEEWRDLVRDAVEEIDEWDPDEEGDEFFDELLSDDGKDDVAKKDDEDSDGEDEDSAALLEQKKTALRILKPISQIYPAILSNRLKKATDSSSISKKLASLMKHMQHIPEDVDEAAGALYEEDWERCVQHLLKIKEHAVKSVNLVASPLNASGDAGTEQTDDKFTSWSKTWLKVMEEVTKSVAEAAD